MESGEGTNTMAEFIAKKKEAEQTAGKDDKDKRREDILKRVAERRKQREEEGGGSKALTDAVSRNNDELKRKTAEHLKEVSELRKTIESLHEQLSTLNAAARNVDQLETSIKTEQEKVATVSAELSTANIKITAQDKEMQALKESNEAAIRTLNQQLDGLKSEKASNASSIRNLQQQVDSLVELKNSEASFDAKVSHLTDEISSKNDEISTLTKQVEIVTLEKETLAKKVKSVEESTQTEKESRQTEISSLSEQIALLQEKNTKLDKENEEIKNVLEETSAITTELHGELNYQKDVIEAQEKALLVQAQLALDSTPDTTVKEVNEGDGIVESNDVPESLARSSDSFEMSLLTEINLLRQNPDAYADNLVDLVTCYEGVHFKSKNGEYSFETKEGVSALEDAIDYLQSCPHKFPALQLFDGLCKSCQYLCDKNGETGSVSANCEDMVSSKRLVAYGSWKGRIMELMNYGPQAKTPRDIVTQWLIDDGNAARSQRTTLLDFDFTAAGIGHGPHKEHTYMVSLAVAKAYHNFGTEEEEEGGEGEKTLKETSDKNFFIITSDPCRTDKKNVSLTLDEKTLRVTVDDASGEQSKITSQQWNLPFGVSPSSISATYNEYSEVVILINKKLEVVDGEQAVHEYQLPVDSSAPKNRLELQVKQTNDEIIFTTEPCLCAAEIIVKIIEGMIVCFESVYMETSESATGTLVTKTVTRKEKVNMPFSVDPSRMSFSSTENKGVSVTITKPSVVVGEISIPIV